MTLHGTVTGDELTIVTELAAPAIEGGRWSAGALVDAIVSGPDGQTVGKGTGRIEPGLRSALVRVRAAGPGPWDVMVRVRGDGERPETDSVSVRRRADTLVGEPLMLRGGRTAASPLQPVAAFQFRRTERIRLEWPLLTAADAYEARLLDRREQPLAYPIATARAETRLTADINLAPLNAGDYLIELIARAGARTERQLVAIRVSMAR
jgi:hypothetical protein